MGKKSTISGTEIDFTTGKSVETLNSKLSIIENQLYAFKNPYVGNKRKMISKIIKSLESNNVEYDSVLDLFSGSAFVSMAMKMLGKVVYSNDFLKSSYFYAVAYVENPGIFPSEEEKQELLISSEHIDKKIFVPKIAKKFEKRFSKNEILFLKNYYNNVVSKFGLYTNIISRRPNFYKSAVCFACLQTYIIEKCFVGGRMSNNQVLAELKHRLDHQRNRGTEMTGKGIRWIKDIYPNDINKRKHIAFNGDVIYLLNHINKNIMKKPWLCTDLVYIDPPYGGLSSDYSELYQFFEEYLYTKLIGYRQIDIDNIKKYTKRFVNKENYGKNFIEMIKLLNGFPCLAISYNNGGWAKIDDILDIIKKYRKNVIVEEFDYDYKYRIQKSREDKAKEYLIIAR